MCIRISVMHLNYLNGVVENNSHVDVSFFIYLCVSNLVCLLFTLQVGLITHI